MENNRTERRPLLYDISSSISAREADERSIKKDDAEKVKAVLSFFYLNLDKFQIFILFVSV